MSREEVTIGYERGFEIHGIDLNELLLHGDRNTVKQTCALIVELADRAAAAATGTAALDVTTTAPKRRARPAWLRRVK